MKTILKEIGVLLLTLTFVFLWQNTASTTLAFVILILITAIIITLFTISARKYKYNVLVVLTTHSSWSLFLFTSAILLGVLATGGVTSVLFFLIYFLSFSIGFAYRLPVLLVYLIGIGIILFPDAIRVDLITNVTRFSVLLVIVPAAYYFGRDFRNSIKHKKQ